MLVGRTVLVVHQLGSLRIVHEFLHDRIPYDRTTELHRDVSEIANGAGRMTDFNRNVGIDPGLDSLDELPVMTDLGLIRNIIIGSCLLHVEPLVGSLEITA